MKILVMILTLLFPPDCGIASRYASSLHGRRTASGARYNDHGLTAAHRSLRFGTRLQVTNPSNGRRVTVTINDRGPFIRGRILDLSTAAARRLGFSGTRRVCYTIL